MRRKLRLSGTFDEALCRTRTGDPFLTMRSRQGNGRASKGPLGCRMSC